MTGATVLTWGAPVRGREAKGLEVFGKALAYFEGLTKEGRVHGHKEFFTVVGDTSDIAGMMIVEGELEELLRLQSDPEIMRLQMEAGAITDGFTIRIFAGGSDATVQERMGAYTETVKKLGYL